ncbi:MAG: hypothetical protein GF421_10830 [Candidatus Aminicenantes bacterium]|nr:hypothetical protein [Candidatus Aminicenantes bacterium]
MNKKTKRMTKVVGYSLMIFMLGSFLYAQDKATDKATVPFSNPSEPGLVKASVHNGSITVIGTSGKEVMVEARVREKLVQDEEIKRNEKAKGLRLVQVDTTGLRVMEDDNVMRISVSSYKQTVDLTIRVPSSSSVSISAHENGDVVIENVNGEIEATNHRGNIRLTGISSAVVAHTYDGEIKAVFKSVSPELPMSFTSWQGDIDVTLPSSTKANLKMKSGRGEVYTDFDLQIVRNPDEEFDFDSRKLKNLQKDDLRNRFYVVTPPTPPKAVDVKADVSKELKESIALRARDAMYINADALDISFNKYIYAKINGGGPVYVFNNNNGDILLRKAK